MLISTWLTAVRNRIQPQRVVKRRSGQKPSAQSLENLETRALLTSPTLVSIRPNVGDILLEGQTRTVAPRELTLQFNPGQQIDASTLAGSIEVTRGGVDRNLNNIGDVPVTIGFVGIGDHPEEVVVRFAENLPDDVYRITIRGTGLTPLMNEDGDIFNNGADTVRNFRLNLGAVVEGVVPQPVLRDKLINIASVANLRDGDRVTVAVGGVRRVFEFNSTGGIRPSSHVAVNFVSTQSAATVATNLQAAIAAEPFAATVTRSGSSLTMVGDAFTPAISRSMVNASAVTVTDGGLRQLRDTVVVHFNEDDLDLASAQNASFYRLINTAGTLSTADDVLLIPSSVTYDRFSNTSVLRFASNLPNNATFALRIGSNSEEETVSGAIQIGTLLSNTFQTNGVIGAAAGNTDVDLYSFTLTSAITVKLDAVPANGLNVAIRLFDNNLGQLQIANATGVGGAETMTRSLLPGTYYVGISSNGNTSYTPGDAASATAGSTTGAYSFSAASLTPFTFGDGNSSFDTATNLGFLGAAQQTVNSLIQAQSIPLPVYPSGTDEPGHRDIPAESHIAASGTGNVVPSAIPVVSYYFGDVYGQDPQGNDLYNAITENQKQRTREIFELWSKKAGFVAQETTAGGIQIITGDLRAFEPNSPPNAAAGLGSAGAFAIMNANTDWGTSEYGGAWFGVALHEIGHALGLDHAYDLISVMGEGEEGGSAPTREPVFPTDHDTLHIQRILRPDSTDIDMFEFELTSPGKISAEIVAERTGSFLDSVLRLYDVNKNLLSQNDNYFSSDSFLSIDLPAGKYFIGVSSTGNAVYDPAIENTGFGGTTDGAYELKLKYSSAATNRLVDAPLTPNVPVAEFDGDADGVAGGEYEFFFRTGTTFFVDKQAAAGTGTIGAPFNRIDLAIEAAALVPGSIVRVVGNGGTDGNDLTPEDAAPYLIGVTPGSVILPDGGTLEVPQGVTLMIDAGSVIKLQGANIDAGSSSQGINRSQSAIQVLGVPGNAVHLTSYLNDNLGGDSNAVGPLPKAGDWGGLVFRDDSDREAAGIFLNYVNKANITFGGGQVIVDSVPQIFTPIYLVSARPTLTFNTISSSASGAMSANPNAFEDSEYRVGPNIHGNVLTRNSVNAMQVRVKTALGRPIDTLDVQARFDDDDIVHVITENLSITGNPGGPLDGVPRLSGRLLVDPGVVLKFGGSRIESTIGNSNLIAEGTKERPVIFTSILDDQYGVGGTFDTTNNASSVAASAGDWGGLIFNATSNGSIDHAVIRYGGGRTPIEGDFAEFNVIEVHQADLRLANSRLEFNESGTGPAGVSPTRNGRGANGAATVFVRGAQPIIVGNEFRDNNATDSFIISIDVNSLNSFENKDRGRSTGPVSRFSEFDNNLGALIRDNLMRNNGINGMEVRGGTLTTQGVWDDTDIVHVVQSEIYLTNHHTYSGLRLQSQPTESLVVKLLGTTAGFTAGGFELDIDDRIGGTVQVIGSPGFPVVLTSLHDDTVGAGFDLDGFPVLDTNNNGIRTNAASPGNWRSIKLEQYSNDRNVRVVMEAEKGLIAGQDSPLPQLLGTLAPNEKSGDDNRPLGFEVHGYISSDTPSDRDTYSFKGMPGTEVWFDLDRTSSHLDTVLELVSSAGSVIARSDGTNSFGTLPLQKAAALGGDHYSQNRLDEGFRIILPGAVGEEGTYFIRVRSKDALTTGAYRLQVRLNQRDEVPGSTVRFADIRWAANGIEMYGMPRHSPLVGEAGEGNNSANNSLAGAEFIGDLLTSDRNALSVSGSLSNANDVDWFSFTVDYEFIQAIAGINSGGKSWATIFDIDYADGLSRPDTILSVYDQTGKLILVSRDSDVVDDQPAPGTGNGLNDLTRGSVGKLDPFIGSVHLPESNGQTYYVAVSSNGRMPAELSQTFAATPSDLLARLEPVNSLRRIVEDHIGFQGYRSLSPLTGPVQINPDKTEGLFDITTAARLNTYVKPFSLADVTLFSISSGGSLTLSNPFTGQVVTNAFGEGDVTDLAMRPDGVLHTVLRDSGSLRVVNPADGGKSGGGDDGIPTFGGGTQNFGGMAFRQNPQVTTAGYELYVANNNSWDFNGTGDDNEAPPSLWRLNPTSGGLFDESTADRIQNLGALPTNIAGLAFGGINPGVNAGNILYAAGTNGSLWRTTIGITGTGRSAAAWTEVTADVTGTGVGFTGLTLGPQNVEDGMYSGLLFATGTDGRLYAFNQTGVLQPIFDSTNDGVADSSSVVFQAGSGVGLAFSPLDFNLWHPTERRALDAGHGINPAIDNSRVPGGMERDINGRWTNEAQGGASFYFGLEQWVEDPDASNAYFNYVGNAQFGVTQRVHRELTTNPAIANTYNLPGGAYGSLVTNSFSLEGYKATERPTVYFNYFLSTENVNLNDDDMRDAARVYVSTNGGTSWELIATNNGGRSPAPRNTMGGNGGISELPRYASHSATQTPDDARQSIQELFDTSNWRQARIDLGKFAGAADVKFRFDFTTSGQMRDASVDNQTYGSIADRDRSLNNQFEGFYIDDIIVGFAGRGEMVTTPSAALGGSFFDAPNDPSGIFQHLAGPYQLEIRRGTEYGRSLDPLTGLLTLQPGRLIDANQRLVSEYSLTMPTSSVIQDGDSYTISDGIVSRTFEFNLTGGVTSPNIAVNVTAVMTKGQVANALANAINGLTGFNVKATTRPSSVNSDVVDLTGATDVTTTPRVAPADLIVNIPATTVSESGPNTSFTVTRTGPIDQPLTVTISLSDVSPPGPSVNALLVLGTGGSAVFDVTHIVVIPAGSASVVLPLQLDPTPNAVYDGSRAVRIRATAAGMNSISDIIDITDDEIPPVPAPPGFTPFGALALQVFQTTVREDSGTKSITGYVTLPQTVNDPDPYDGGPPLVVFLTSSDGSEIRSDDVSFEDGDIRVFFSLDVIDEFFDGGDVPVTIFASARGYATASATVTVNQSANVNYVERLGDKNVHREQGMVVIESNIIRNFGNYGVLSDAAPRSAGNQTNPASVRNLSVLNAQRLVPGVTIRNNVIAQIGVGGILFSGDTNGGGQPLAPVPFGKIINNTIYGGTTPRGFGIRVEQNASPTLLNNIVSNTSTGISIDGSSVGTTVVGSSLFKGNASNGTVGSDAIQLLLAADPLFVNPGSNNFYPAPGSLAVDSAINKLGDRPALTAVKSPLGIPDSDSVAPEFDLYGQQRLDDGSQATPPGLGSDIFKDRGAVERADFQGPFVRFSGPAEDNNVGDLDGILTRIHVDNLVFPTTLSLDLLDSGIGVDDTQVRSSQFQLRQNGVLLVENIDYRWRYNPNNNRVYFISVTTFPTDTRYSISVNNSTATGVRDLAGNRLSANQADGTTIFTLLLTDGVNDAPVVNVPDVQTTNEDTPLVFNSANSNLITVGDRDAYLGITDAAVNFTAADGILDVTLVATDGLLSLSGTTGLTLLPGSPAGTIRFTGSVSDINRALDGLIFTPAFNYFNLTEQLLIQITVSDLGNFGPLPTTVRTTTETIPVSVVAVNDPPTYSLATVSPVNEDAGLRTVPNFIQGLFAGAANETLVLGADSVTISLGAVPSGPHWTTMSQFFTTAPTYDHVTNSMSFRTAPNVNGSINLRVDLKDGDLTESRNFTLVVNPLNDKPVFTLRPRPFSVTDAQGQIVTVAVHPDPTQVALITSQEDQSLVDIDLRMIQSSAPAVSTALDEASQVLTWRIVSTTLISGNLGFATGTLQITPEGVLEYRPRPNTAGVMEVVVQLEDDGSSATGNENAADPIKFTIVVEEVNDTPVARSLNYTLDKGYGLLLDATPSFDVDENNVPTPDVLTYSWDLNGDGQFGDVVSMTPQTLVPWSVMEALEINKPGWYTVGLRVTDSRGAQNSTTAALRILIVDYGDAPDSYGTTRDNNGAAHVISSGLLLGTLRDEEMSGVPTPDATGDGADEDGVQFPVTIETAPAGGSALRTYIDVRSSGVGKLDAWLDLNGNGSFDHATEHIFGGVSRNVVRGLQRIFFDVPAGATIGSSMMRFRLSTAGSLQPTDASPAVRAADGEVEDYAVSILAVQAPVTPTVTLPVDFNLTDGQIPQTTDRTPTIAWTNHSENYTYNVTIRNAAGNLVFSRARLQEDTTTVPGLLAPGVYTASVVGINKVGTRALPAVYEFRVVSLVVSSPTGDIGTSRPTITWNHVPGSTTYTIQMSSLTTGSNVLYRTITVGQSANPASFVVPSNLPLGRYSVRIRATDARNQPGDWGPLSSFTVRTAPVLTGPAATVTNTTRPTFSWTAVPGADYYQVQLLNVTDNVTLPTVTNIRTNSYVPTTHLALGRYRVIVTAFNSSNESSFASAPRFFNLAPRPVMVNPFGRLDDATPTFAWQAVLGADKYELTVKRDFGNFGVVYRQIGLPGNLTQHTMLTPLPLGRYTYEVRALNEAAIAGQPGAYSSVSLVTTFTSAEAPVITGPASTTFLPRPVFTWTNPPLSPANAVSDIRISIKEGASYRVVVSRQVTGTSFTPTADLGIGSYRVEVRTYSSVDSVTVSNWSVARNFRVTTAPALIGPAGRVADATPTLNWSGVLGGQTYQVEIRSLSMNVVAYTVTGINALNFTVPADLPIGQYQFRVQARSAFGEMSDWSPSMNFQIVAAPVLFGPASSTFNRTPSFAWNDMAGIVGNTLAGATSYDFSLDFIPAAGQTDVVYPVVSLTNTDYTVPQALPLGLYRARVRARGADITGDYSAILEFYVGGNPVVNAIGSTTSQTPTISWRPVDGSAGYSIFIALESNPTVAVVQQSGIGSTSYTVASTLAKGRYRVWVRAVNAADGVLSGPMLSEAPSITFTIVDASDVQTKDAASRYTLTADGLNMSDFVSESTISMLPSFVSGSPQALVVIAEQSVDAELQIGESEVVEAANASDTETVEQNNQLTPQTDEVLAAWDQQKWWDAANTAPVPVVAPVTAVAAENAETKSASTGLLGSLIALAPWALRRRRKDDSST